MKTGRVALALRRARIGAGFTQAGLARRVGTTQSAIARAEGGSVMPSLDLVERIVVATGATLRLGGLVVVPADPDAGADATDAALSRALGGYRFNPWDRDPAPAERRSLESDGLDRERFAGAQAPRPRRR